MKIKWTITISSENKSSARTGLSTRTLLHVHVQYVKLNQHSRLVYAVDGKINDYEKWLTCSNRMRNNEFRKHTRHYERKEYKHVGSPFI
jgi:hypothetical protein